MASRKRNKFKIWWFQHNSQGVQKCVLASITHSLQIITFDFSLQGWLEAKIEKMIEGDTLFIQNSIQDKEIISRHPVCHAQIAKSSKSSLRKLVSWPIVIPNTGCFWPKGNLRPILWFHRSIWRAQKLKDKLTTAMATLPNRSRHTVSCLSAAHNI